MLRVLLCNRSFSDEKYVIQRRLRNYGGQHKIIYVWTLFVFSFVSTNMNNITQSSPGWLIFFGFLSSSHMHNKIKQSSGLSILLANGQASDCSVHTW